MTVNTPLTEQIIFDIVVEHFKVQKVKSKIGLYCKYRGKEGRSCAIGCLITDEEYDPRMDDTKKGGVGNISPSFLIAWMPLPAPYDPSHGE